MLSEADIAYIRTNYRPLDIDGIYAVCLRSVSPESIVRKDDRRRFGRPPTRDALIVAARERYPNLFAVGSHGR